MQGYWEKSVKNHLEIEKRKYQEKLKNNIDQKKEKEVSQVEKVNKFSINDIVMVKDEYRGYGKGTKDKYRIVEWIYEASYSESDGKHEFVCYNLEGVNNGIYLDAMMESELELHKSAKPSNSDETLDSSILKVKERKDLTNTDVDDLLDQYNKFSELHNFINSNGIIDNQYREKADKILSFLAS